MKNMHKLQLKSQNKDRLHRGQGSTLILCLRVYNRATVQQYKLWHFLRETPKIVLGRYERKCVQYVETSAFLENERDNSDNVHMMEKPPDKKKLCIYKTRSSWSEDVAEERHQSSYLSGYLLNFNWEALIKFSSISNINFTLCCFSSA